jgi:hypothetical protein
VSIKGRDAPPVHTIPPEKRLAITPVRPPRQALPRQLGPALTKPVYSTERRRNPTPGAGGRVLRARGRGQPSEPRRRRSPKKPLLRISQILAWADAHHTRTGRWPSGESGVVHDAPWETWSAIQHALQDGLRGLRPGSTVVRLLYKHRGVRNQKRPPPLTLEQILAWADRHKYETGRWPLRATGVVRGEPGESWAQVNDALFSGMRGLPGGSSLAQLLDERRHVRNRSRAPRLSESDILRWAKAHFRRTGRWPLRTSGSVVDGPRGETWNTIANAFAMGIRGLRRSQTLPRLLHRHFGVRLRSKLPRLTIARILAWADAHRQRFGEWPLVRSGKVHGATEESWSAIDHALRRGSRGLPAGSSLPRLLEKRRNVPNASARPRLSIAQILMAADAHHRRTGRWPAQASGPIADWPGENWAGIDRALRLGHRGLEGESSLAQLLIRERQRRSHMHLAPLSIGQILAWADAHRKSTGRWPGLNSAWVGAATGERWRNINQLLRNGGRGLPGGSSLAQLLEKRRGVPNARVRPVLRVPQIMKWARAYRRRMGRWPIASSGRIVGAAGESWAIINGALSKGRRGLPGGTTLARLLAELSRNPTRRQ